MSSFFKWTVADLSCPDANHRYALFDWQKCYNGASSLNFFGGIDGLVEGLHTSTSYGLSTIEANSIERKNQYGINYIPPKKMRTLREFIIESFKNLPLIILTIAGSISLVLGFIMNGFDDGWIEGFSILLAVGTCVFLSALTDMNKEKELFELCQENQKRYIEVTRDGKIVEILIYDIVVGDIVHINQGDSIPCDGIFIAGNKLSINESKLTGESDNVIKNEKDPFLISSTECFEGSCIMLVTSVGKNSVFGRMKLLIEGQGEEQTPLQLKLEDLTKFLSTIGLVTCGVTLLGMLIIYGVRLGNEYADKEFEWTAKIASDILEIFITAVSMLVLAIPEGLPLAVTLALAYSVKQMMKDNNLVRHLSACETMGGATAICSDKTGTLTQGKMSVVQICEMDNINKNFHYLNENKSGEKEEYEEFLNKCKNLDIKYKEKLLECCILNNDGFLSKDEEGEIKGVGSPLDIALIHWCNRLGMNYEDIRKMYPNMEVMKEEDRNRIEKGVIRHFAFHSNRKRCSCLVKYDNNHYRLYVKGAPEILLRLSDYVVDNKDMLTELTGEFEECSNGSILGNGNRREIMKESVYPMATNALRTLAIAYRDFENIEDWDEMVEYEDKMNIGVGKCPKIESHLILLGFLGFQDPVRHEVPHSVSVCNHAGIRVRMVTGDNVATAKVIARQCNIYHDKPWTDSYGITHSSGICLMGSQFREMAGGLVLPAHFYHECHCKDCSEEDNYIENYIVYRGQEKTPYPSIIGHKISECDIWTPERKAMGRSGCTSECKERGCMYSCKDAYDDREIEKYKIVRNQGKFDEIIDTLDVMARAAPSDKQILVSGLMERDEVVAVTGDGTNDGPALAKSSVGFAMGIGGTSVAKEASDIILMDDNFSSIVKACMWGRNIYENIRKFLQFQLVVSYVAVFFAFIASMWKGESPIRAVQILWVNLAMDTMAGLAFTTEKPNEKLLKKKPYGKRESIIAPIMWRNISVSVVYNIIILLLILGFGEEWFELEGPKNDGINENGNTLYTFIFHVFVLLHVFNELNSRCINNERNIFTNFKNAIPFFIIVLSSIIIQILIVQFTGPVFSVKPLSWKQHLYAIAIGFTEVILYQLIAFIPTRLFSRHSSSSSSYTYSSLHPHHYRLYSISNYHKYKPFHLYHKGKYTNRKPKQYNNQYLLTDIESNKHLLNH
ncbi:hypothetical protein WA158_004000 [Blastocystis sp. Blastoise]